MAKPVPVEFYGLEMFNEYTGQTCLFIYDEWGHATLAAEKLAANDGDLSSRDVSDFVRADLSDDWDMQNIMEDCCAGIRMRADVDADNYRYYDTGMSRERELKNGTVDDPVFVYVVNDEPISVNIEPENFCDMVR